MGATTATAFRKGRRHHSQGMVVIVTMIVVMAMSLGVSGTQDQPELENRPMRRRGQVARASPRTQVEEINDKPASIDHLLEEATRPAHLSWEDAEDGGCTQGTYLSELDLCLTPGQLSHFQPVSLPHNTVSNTKATNRGKAQRHKRQIHRLVFSLWQGAVVPYIFNVTFPEYDRRLVLSAMAEWERMTCIRFRPATPEDTDLIIIKDGKRCSTNIGRVGGRQLMTLARPCRRSRILIHELGHVLGLIHEHQRQDRDSYVTVVLHNVRNSSQERYQFSKLAPSPLNDHQVHYSYTSIMHYGRNYFAKSPDLTTLLTADPKFQDVIGRAVVPADSDAEAVNLMYGCAAPTQNRLPDATCEMFKRTGECEGYNKDTIRPLCLRTCQQAVTSHVSSYGGGAYPPIRSSGAQTASVFSKTHAPLWSQSSNVIGGGTRLSDAFSSTSRPAPPAPPAPWAAAPSAKRISAFGNLPYRPFSRPSAQQQQQPSVHHHHQQQQPSSHHQQPQQQQQQMRQTPQRATVSVSSKWMPTMLKTRPTPTTGGIHIHQRTGPGQLPAWLRSRSQPRPSSSPTARKPATEGRSAKPPRPTAVEREPIGVEPVGGAAEIQAHNMKALSPEALPESSTMRRPRRPPQAGSAQPVVRQYDYNRPQHMGLLHSMLSHDLQLPSEAPQQGVHVTRPVHRPASSAHGTVHSAHGTAPHSAHGPLSARQIYTAQRHDPVSPRGTVQVSSPYVSGGYRAAVQPVAPTEAPSTLLGLLGSSLHDLGSPSGYGQSRDGWYLQGSNAHAGSSPHYPAHSPEGWYAAPAEPRGSSSGAGGYLAYRQDSNLNSGRTGPVMHQFGPLGPDSQSYYV